MTIMAPKFSLGTVGITTEAEQALREASEASEENYNFMEGLKLLLWKHMHGEWGDVDAHDRRVNETALKSGARILSAYTLFGVKLWIITDAAWGDDPRERQVTTVLRPEDY